MKVVEYRYCHLQGHSSKFFLLAAHIFFSFPCLVNFPFLLVTLGIVYDVKATKKEKKKKNERKMTKISDSKPSVVARKVTQTSAD